MMSLQWSAETNAWITAIFFKWLVGPLETKEVEVPFNGEKQTWRSGVQIKKCRYLEQSGCVGESKQLRQALEQLFYTYCNGILAALLIIGDSEVSIPCIASMSGAAQVSFHPQ